MESSFFWRRTKPSVAAAPHTRSTATPSHGRSVSDPPRRSSEALLPRQLAQIDLKGGGSVAKLSRIPWLTTLSFCSGASLARAGICSSWWYLRTRSDECSGLWRYLLRRDFALNGASNPTSVAALMHYQLKAGVAAEGEPDLTWLKTRACASCTLVSLVPPPEMLLRDNARMLLWSHSDGSIRALSRMLFDGGSTSLATGWQCSVCEAPLETSDEFRARTKLSIAGIPRPGPGAMEMVLDGNGKTARSSGPADIVYAAAIILSRRGIRIGADEDPLRTSAVVWQPRKPARSAPRAPREALSTPPPPPLPPSSSIGQPAYYDVEAVDFTVAFTTRKLGIKVEFANDMTPKSLVVWSFCAVGTEGELAGIQRGDIFCSVDGEVFPDRDSLKRALQQRLRSASRPLRVGFKRQGGYRSNSPTSDGGAAAGKSGTEIRSSPSPQMPFSASFADVQPFYALYGASFELYAEASRAMRAVAAAKERDAHWFCCRSAIAQCNAVCSLFPLFILWWICVAAPFVWAASWQLQRGAAGTAAAAAAVSTCEHANLNDDVNAITQCPSRAVATPASNRTLVGRGLFGSERATMYCIVAPFALACALYATSILVVLPFGFFARWVRRHRGEEADSVSPDEALFVLPPRFPKAVLAHLTQATPEGRSPLPFRRLRTLDRGDKYVSRMSGEPSRMMLEPSQKFVLETFAACWTWFAARVRHRHRWCCVATVGRIDACLRRDTQCKNILVEAGLQEKYRLRYYGRDQILQARQSSAPPPTGHLRKPGCCVYRDPCLKKEWRFPPGGDGIVCSRSEQDAAPRLCVAVFPLLAAEVIMSKLLLLSGVRQEIIPGWTRPFSSLSGGVLFGTAASDVSWFHLIALVAVLIAVTLISGWQLELNEALRRPNSVDDLYVAEPGQRAFGRTRLLTSMDYYRYFVNRARLFLMPLRTALFIACYWLLAPSIRPTIPLWLIDPCQFTTWRAQIQEIPPEMSDLDLRRGISYLSYNLQLFVISVLHPYVMFAGAVLLALIARAWLSRGSNPASPPPAGCLSRSCWSCGLDCLKTAPRLGGGLETIVSVVAGALVSLAMLIAHGYFARRVGALGFTLAALQEFPMSSRAFVFVAMLLVKLFITAWLVAVVFGCVLTILEEDIWLRLHPYVMPITNSITWAENWLYMSRYGGSHAGRCRCGAELIVPGLVIVLMPSLTGATRVLDQLWGDDGSESITSIHTVQTLFFHPMKRLQTLFISCRSNGPGAAEYDDVVTECIARAHRSNIGALSEIWTTATSQVEKNTFWRTLHVQLGVDVSYFFYPLLVISEGLVCVVNVLRMIFSEPPTQLLNTTSWFKNNRLVQIAMVLAFLHVLVLGIGPGVRTLLFIVFALRTSGAQLVYHASCAHVWLQAAVLLAGHAASSRSEWVLLLAAIPVHFILCTLLNWIALLFERLFFEKLFGLMGATSRLFQTSPRRPNAWPIGRLARADVTPSLRGSARPCYGQMVKAWWNLILAGTFFVMLFALPASLFSWQVGGPMMYYVRTLIFPFGTKLWWGIVMVVHFVVQCCVLHGLPHGLLVEAGVKSRPGKFDFSPMIQDAMIDAEKATNATVSSELPIAHNAWRWTVAVHVGVVFTLGVLWAWVGMDRNETLPEYFLARFKSAKELLPEEEGVPKTMRGRCWNCAAFFCRRWPSSTLGFVAGITAAVYALVCFMLPILAFDGGGGEEPWAWRFFS